MSNSEPLWKVMANAYDRSTAPDGKAQNWTEMDGYSAEIRSIVDWIRKRHPFKPDSPTYIGAMLVAAELLAEADRAERSNG